MNDNINLCEILKDCPRGTNFWSKIHGNVFFEEILNDDKIAIKVVAYNKYGQRNTVCFSSKGYFDERYDNAEVILVPSKTQQDWSKWKCPKPKFDPKTLKPFDKVLARIKYGMWYADFISLPIVELNPVLCVMGDKDFDTIIPYNDDTKHLLGTTEEAPEYYRYWED